MKRNILTSLLIIFLLHCGLMPQGFAQSPLSVDAPKGGQAVPGILYIQLKAKHGIDFERISPTHTGNVELDQFFKNYGVSNIYLFDADAKNYSVARRHGIDRMYVINFSREGSTPFDAAQEIVKLDAVEKASPRLVQEKCYTPNDPAVSQQYALDNMSVKTAWDISKGSTSIIIADVDEGVNYNHEDLAANIYKINGHFGYNIVGTPDKFGNFNPTFDPMPSPTFNHGTMTSGCFGAVADNNLGGAGTGLKCKILAIRISDSTGTLLGGWEGIQYAVEHGAKIINCSWGVSLNLKLPGGQDYFDFHKSFIDEASDTGALIVAAAGNGSDNIDDSTFLPACYHGVLCVGATTRSNSPAGFTNFGHAVSVYAPGENIFSTSFPGNSAYDSENGTSFSCPLTSGVAGLLWAEHPDWLPEFISWQIIQTADNVVYPSNRTNFWGLVDAYKALTQNTVPGLGITDFSIDGVDKGTLQYLNKEYTLNVTFKNYMALGSGLQVKLLPVQGYTVQQAIANLGQMNPLQSSIGIFNFTRDGSDNGPGYQLELFFLVTYGSATVEGRSYTDTLHILVDISGNDTYVTKSVSGGVESNSTGFGNIFPNPASGNTIINYTLGRAEYTKVSLYDVLGRTLSTLSNGIFGEGMHQLQFDARNFENGMYFLSLESEEGIQTSRLMILH